MEDVSPEQTSSKGITRTAFDEYILTLSEASPETGLTDISTADDIIPNFTEILESNYLDVSSFCFADLLEPPFHAMNTGHWPHDDTTAISPEIQTKLTIAKHLVNQLEPCEQAEDSDDRKWFNFYRLSVVGQFATLDYNLADDFYLSHPIQEQFLIAFLREPCWRMPYVTPLYGECYNQDVYVDTINCFYELFETGTVSDDLSIEAEGYLSSLCNEQYVWSMSQSSDTYAITLLIQKNGEEVAQIIYTPANAADNQ